MSMQPLLIELGTEELPVAALPGLAQALFDGVIAALEGRGVAVERGNARPLHSPRRLAVLLPGVASQQPERHSEVLGPYLDIALDANGAPTRALAGFAAKAGVAWDALDRTTDAKGERFVHRASTAGARTSDLLQAVLDEALAAMPIPRPMRWGDHPHGFARPLHWLVALLGDEVVELQALGIRAGRNSRGHRFMHDKPVWIGRPGDYVEALRAARVLVDPDERRARIVSGVEAAARGAGGSARIDADTLEQVNCLVEWPVAVACSFDRRFLVVPREALVATMQTNQKFFPVLDEDGGLSAHFIGIANIASRDPAQVRKGYERVIRPRFADAEFFFDEDLKQGLVAMGDGLKTVTYQARLGSVADKVARVAALAEAIAKRVGVDPQLARRAAELAKNDLQSRMVNEFPELQGVAGRHYATHAGEHAEVALAIDEAYMPRLAADAIAPSRLGQVLAIAERLDTLAGGFAAGLKPTGSKDPFALRRTALGLARTLLEGGHDLSLHGLVEAAVALQPISHPQPGALDITRFVYERLRGYYADRKVPSARFDAAFDAEHGSLPDFDARLAALADFAELPEAAALAAANKRIRNILRKADGAASARVEPVLFAEAAERALHQALQAAISDTDPLLQRRDYVGVLSRLAALRPPVDAFFDAVMVNAEDPAVRGNRLALLQQLADRLGSVAAIEHLSA